MHVRPIAAPTLLLLAVSAAAGLAAAATLDGDPANGRQVFVKRCAVCHGDDGDGNGKVTFNPPPRDLTDPDALKTEGPDELLAVIRDGGPAVGLAKQMPGFGKILDEKELIDVATYVDGLCD